MLIVRWRGDVDPARTPAPLEDSILDLNDWKVKLDVSLNRHRGELARSRADKAASCAAYERERAARLGWLGRWVKP